MNAHLNVKSHVRSLHVMSDKQFEFSKTLLQWLREKQINDPNLPHSKSINMLTNIVRTRQYNSKDRNDLNKLRKQYILEKS